MEYSRTWYGFRGGSWRVSPGLRKSRLGVEHAARLLEQGPVVLDVLEGLEADVEIERSAPRRKPRRVGADERGARRLFGDIHGNDVARSGLGQNPRAVSRAAGGVEDPEPGGPGRRPSVSGEMLVPKPGRRETIEREPFHSRSSITGL
jgi:hypothetical protein